MTFRLLRAARFAGRTSAVRWSALAVTAGSASLLKKPSYAPASCQGEKPWEQLRAVLPDSEPGLAVELACCASMARTIDADVVHGFITLHDLEGLRAFAPLHFDWSQPLGEDQLPALVYLVAPETLCQPAAQHNHNLEMVEWLLKVGADPQQRVRDDVEKIYGLQKRSNPEETKISFNCRGQSALSLCFAWLREMQKCRGNAEWTTEEQYLKQLLPLFSRSSSHETRHGTDVAVPQSIVDLWESMRDLTASHNVIFESSDGEVAANEHILTVASPVLKAMLESAMTEGTSRRIQVKDSPSSGISLFLDVLYTSSTREDPDHKTVLAAVDLAHRWQVHSVVQILCTALHGMIDANSFVAIAEAAVLKGLETLVRACASFGSTDEQVQAMLKKGDLPVAVRKLLRKPEHDGADERELKKRRRFRPS
ncbi:BT4 [Symbiodinium sp. CCMP2456]|nr:BT4 [Symbiodinium sp. CCMP2456]